MDYKEKVNSLFNEINELTKLPFGTIPHNVKVYLFEASANLARACNAYDEVKSSGNRNKDNLDKLLSNKAIKSSYQILCFFDGKYQPRVIDFITDKGLPLWTDFDEEKDNGQRFSDEELPKVAKQLEDYYSSVGGGMSDIEIVKDNGDSVYLEEYLMEGSFDKAWQDAINEEVERYY